MYMLYRLNHSIRQLKDITSILNHKNTPKEYVKLVSDMSKKNTTEIRINHALTEPITTWSGIKQGESLSPLLFSLIMDQLGCAVKDT